MSYLLLIITCIFLANYLLISPILIFNTNTTPPINNNRCWDVASGKAYTLTSPANIQWETHTCVLGYCLLGIWPPGAQGNDINAVDVSPELNLCVTGDDEGKLNLMTYPCIVKHAPRKELNAHSSHVSNVKFVYRQADHQGYGGGLNVVTVGGRDTTMTVWSVLPTQSHH